MTWKGAAYTLKSVIFMHSLPEQASAFPPTRWSLVVSSREPGDPALEELCRLYWQPLYSFCRRSGLNVEDSEDVTQRFFHDLVENRAALLEEASPGAGRLRSLFLSVLQRRITDHHRHATREKRGSGQLVSLDTGAAEAVLNATAPGATPEQVFDRQWVLSLLNLAMSRLEQDFSAAGRRHHFAALVPFLHLGETEGSYPELQQVLGLSEASARQTVHRFRDRYRRHLRSEIGQTLESPGDEAAIDRELEELRAVLRSV